MTRSSTWPAAVSLRAAGPPMAPAPPRRVGPRRRPTSSPSTASATDSPTTSRAASPRSTPTTRSSARSGGRPLVGRVLLARERHSEGLCDQAVQPPDQDDRRQGDAHEIAAGDRPGLLGERDRAPLLDPDATASRLAPS